MKYTKEDITVHLLGQEDYNRIWSSMEPIDRYVENVLAGDSIYSPGTKESYFLPLRIGTNHYIITECGRNVGKCVEWLESRGWSKD
jgi:hypothetical protein